jgi:hypothetical protein
LDCAEETNAETEACYWADAKMLEALSGLERINVYLFQSIYIGVKWNKI